MYSEEFLKKMKEKLDAEMQRVQNKINDLTANEKPLDNPQWDETANDAIEDIQQESLLKIYRELERKVQKAIDRINDKTYGQCHECNVYISEEKLEKEPWATHCKVECQKKHIEKKKAEESM